MLKNSIILLLKFILGGLKMSKDTFRLATVADADEILDLTLKAYKPIRDLNISFSAAFADIHLITDNINGNSTYVLERDSKIIATITVRFPWNDENLSFRYPFIWWFAVHSDYKKNGEGKKLLKYVEETVLRDTLKAPAVILATSTKHPWLVEMYKRKGYEIYFEKKIEGDTLVYMHKELIPERFNEELLVTNL